jgi:hypothetical protein
MHTHASTHAETTPQMYAVNYRLSKGIGKPTAYAITAWVGEMNTPLLGTCGIYRKQMCPTLKTLPQLSFLVHITILVLGT